MASSPIVGEPRPAPATAPPLLENGDPLGATEFLRRFEAIPEVKKAELVQGTVHMASPVRLDLHAEGYILSCTRFPSSAPRQPCP